MEKTEGSSPLTATTPVAYRIKPSMQVRVIYDMISGEVGSRPERSVPNGATFVFVDFPRAIAKRVRSREAALTQLFGVAFHHFGLVN
jgi:hypothetical protein